MKTYYIGKKFTDTKFNFRETCFGICEQNGKILLTYKSSKNEYSLPGGGIEKNELKHNCLKREFIEETGYQISKICNLAIIDCYWLADGKWPMESKANIFVVDVKSKDKINTRTEDGCIATWIDKDNVFEYISLPYQIKALEIYFSQIC